MFPKPNSWYDLILDVRILILSSLSLTDAISLNTAYPSPAQTKHINYRLDAVRPLHEAWVKASQPALRSYSNPQGLRTKAARAALSLAEFSELSCLPLSGANLTSLRGISEFRNLRLLDVSHNSLQHVSAELGACQQLRVLDLGKNKLESFPDVILKLPQLRTLLLYSNSIPILPENWDHLPYLHRIGLFDCGITGSLPEQLCSMLGTQTDQCRCRSANLQMNKLDRRTIDNLFSKFPKMEYAVVI